MARGDGRIINSNDEGKFCVCDCGEHFFAPNDRALLIPSSFKLDFQIPGRAVVLSLPGQPEGIGFEVLEKDMPVTPRAGAVCPGCLKKSWKSWQERGGRVWYQDEGPDGPTRVKSRC